MIEIREATLADVDLIHDMATVAFPATYRAILTPGQIDYMMKWMYDSANIQCQMTDEGHVYFIAYDEGAAAGYASVQPDGTDCYHLQKIYVLPHRHGCGVGRALLRHIVEVIHHWHPAPCRLELNVNRHNAAIGFYRHLGFRILRSGDFDIGGGYFMHDYIMGMDI